LNGVSALVNYVLACEQGGNPVLLARMDALDGSLASLPRGDGQLGGEAFLVTLAAALDRLARQ
jgi:hypothetical protein